MIPEHLARFSVQVPSLFPGSVRAGYYICHDKRATNQILPPWCLVPGNIEAGLNTNGGLVRIDFPSGRVSLPFVKALQMSTLRKAGKIETLSPYFEDGKEELGELI